MNNLSKKIYLIFLLFACTNFITSCNGNKDKETIESDSLAVTPSIYYKDNILHVHEKEYPMIFVDGGTFTKGAGTENSDNPEIQNETSVNSFYIGSTEITEFLWYAIMDEEVLDSIRNYSEGDYPITYVSWLDCQEFIKRLNNITEMQFRLPTDTEWEFAARGGIKSKGYIYAGSNELDEVGWYNGNSYGEMHTVGEKKPNELGLFDMSGNASELTSDYYYYNSKKKKNVYTPKDGTQIVTRGGSCVAHFEFICLPGYRLHVEKNSSMEYMGFRLAL